MSLLRRSARWSAKVRFVVFPAALGLSGLACRSGALPQAASGPGQAPAEGSRALLIAAELKEDPEIAKAFREYYTKYEYRVPMRDGVHLFTSVYVPKDRSRTYPMLMERTPYGIAPYGVDTYPEHHLRWLVPYLREGYILVGQDVRGCFMSEGTFVDIRPHAANERGIDESTDTFDTIDWMVKNVPANSGKVGLWGISYPGFYAAQGAVNAHPALKAVSPQAPVTEWFLGDDVHHNGAFLTAGNFDFISMFGKVRAKPVKPDKEQWQPIDRDGEDAYDFFLDIGSLANVNARHFEDKMPFWNEIMQHETRDAFWQVRDPRPHYKNAKPAIMTVGGWFDAEDLFGALATYRAFEQQSPGADNTLIMGPWHHGGWIGQGGDHLGNVTFGADTSEFFREHIMFPFFQRYLKGKSVEPPRPEAWVFETGTNTWQRYAAWPPAEAKPVFVSFRTGGKLSASPASASEGAGGFDAYVSDPAKPVPYRDKFSVEIDETYMVEDQRFASRRPDVLTYETGDLESDVTLGGPIEARLWVSTTGTDADFVVKLVDVYPQDYPDPSPNPQGVRMGGYQQLVRAEIMRGKFRTSFEKPVPFEPGKPSLVRFSIPDTLHTFRSGHRIMVQVQSSWFPLVDRNPQTFMDIRRAKDTDFHVATHRIYHTAAMPSGIEVSLLRGKLP